MSARFGLGGRVGDGYVSSEFGKRQGDGTADTLGRPGYKHSLPVSSLVHKTPSATYRLLLGCRVGSGRMCGVGMRRWVQLWLAGVVGLTGPGRRASWLQLCPRCSRRKRSAPWGGPLRRRSLCLDSETHTIGKVAKPCAMTCTRTVLPVGMTVDVALPSGSVLTARLPSSAVIDGLKITADS